MLITWVWETLCNKVGSQSEGPDKPGIALSVGKDMVGSNRHDGVDNCDSLEVIHKGLTILQ